MPVMDGKKATQEILKLSSKAMEEMSEEDRADLGSGFCNILALTAYTSQANKNECLEAGMKDVYPKPLRADQIMGVLEQYFYN